MKYNCIVAHDLSGAIGKNNQIPWRLKDDLKFFKSITENNVVVMGRKTYESIGKALPNRINIVLSRDKSYTLPDAIVMHSKQEVDGYCEKITDDKEVFIIGGAEIYDLFRDDYDVIYRTLVYTRIEKPDAFFDVNICLNFEKEEMGFHRKNYNNEYDFEIIKYNRIVEYSKFCDELIDNLPEWFYDSVYDVYYPDNSRQQEIENNLLKGIFEKKYNIKQGTELYVMAYFKIVERTFAFDLKSLSFTCDLKPVEAHLFQILMKLGDQNDCIFKLKDLSYRQNTWYGTIERIEIE